MTMFFNEPHYARQALANSLVRIGSSPVWIGAIGDDFSADLYYPLNRKKSHVRDITKLKRLNIEPVPLGYVNLKKTASFIQRVPRRRWKQGFNRDAVNGLITEDTLRSRALANCILGRYPSFEKALSRIEAKEVRSVAFHRNWAIQVGIVTPSLVYRNKYVGIIDQGECKLSPNFEYLTESLEEVLNEHS